MLAKHLNLPFKQEPNEASTTSELDADFQVHIKNQSSASKFLFYWLDAFEEQFNANGTVYLFGKMPILKQKQEGKSDTLSFVSVCCVVKNIPKVVYVLPRKYKRNKTDEEVTMEQVTKEVEALLEKNKIHSYRTRVVKKNFAFDQRGKFP